MTVAHAPDPRGPVAGILDRLDKVRKIPAGGWVARCPAHQDRSPSLKIDESVDGKALLHCHAGCTTSSILHALGLTDTDLFPQPTEQRREVAVYPYHDENGTHLYDVVRFEPKTFRQRRPGGAWGLGDTRRVLYRLPQVRQAIDNGEAVYIVEGEKDADTIVASGAAATCNPMGAGKWRADYTQQLAGLAQAIIVADNDDPGIEHAQQVARSLEQASIPHRIVMPAHGKDATDHLGAGRTLDEFVPRIPPAAPAAIRTVPLADFANATDDVADPLIGTPDETLLPNDGLLLMYGDGGAGKTTLSIDALAHLASGTPWLNIQIPQPIRILLIENEGPRGPFRRRLAAKISAWPHQPFHPNVIVLEEPWTRFTLTDQTYRHALAHEIDQHQIELVIVGPLASLGAKGTGTPDEINEFDDHIKDLRAHTHRTFALWIVHHENKAGDVSGAWERYPDSLVHVQAQGNGRTRVHWRKVRWSSALHQTSSNLVWTDGASFTLEEQKTRDLHAELLEAFTADDAWRTAKESATLIKANVDHVRQALGELVERHAMRTETGPLGRRPNAVCWRLKTDSDPPSHHESVAPLEGFARETDSLTRPIYESVSESVESEPDETNQPDPSQSSQITSEDDPEVTRLLELYGTRDHDPADDLPL